VTTLEDQIKVAAYLNKHQTYTKLYMSLLTCWWFLSQYQLTIKI